MDFLENLNSSMPFNFLFVVEKENKQQNLKTRDRCEINTDKLELLALYLKSRGCYIRFIHQMDGCWFLIEYFCV